MEDPQKRVFPKPLNPDLQKWIEQSEHYQTAPTIERQQYGFASNLYHTCTDLYRDIWKAYRIGRAKSSPYRTRIHDNFSQLWTWGEIVKNGKLDAVLESSDKLRDCVLEALSHIIETLIKGACELDPVLASSIKDDIESPLGQAKTMLEKTRTILEEDSCTESDSDSDTGSHDLGNPRVPGRAIKSFVEDMDTYLTCLTDLLPTLEHKAEQRDLSGRVIVGGPYNIYFQVSEPAEQYVRQICDKYPKAPKGLAERLGEANWQRFQRIRDKDQEEFETATDTKGNLELAKSAFAPVSQFQDSGLGSSIPALSQYAATVASHTSYLSSQADKDKGRLRVPSAPKEVIDGLPFDCSICGKTLTKIRNRVEWKMHVFHDLQPYICCAPASECRDSLVTFPSRKLWADHEFSQHHVFEVWDCKDCLKEFGSEQTYTKHVELDHHLQSKKQHIQELLRSARRSVSQSVEDRPCPLCLRKGWQSRRLFAKHLGGHMEGIALSSLPRDVDSDLDEEDSDCSEVEKESSTEEEEGQDLSQVAANAEATLQSRSSETLQSNGEPRPRTTLGRKKSNNKLMTEAERFVFVCTFHLYGCEAVFTSKNKWKRHVSSQHLCLGFYRCQTGNCKVDPHSSKAPNDFNRKDLFTQHHRRMHTPRVSGKAPNTKAQQDFENSLKRLQEQCWHEERAPPQRTTCGFCSQVFKGKSAWDERMEHVGKHYEAIAKGTVKAEDMHENEDEDLQQWALQEGIIEDHGRSGFWLVNLELSGRRRRRN